MLHRVAPSPCHGQPRPRPKIHARVNGLLAGKLPAGKRLAMGYRFGKFSVAIADDDGKASAKAKPVALTLTQALGL